MKLTLEQLLHTIRNRLAPIRSVCGRCPVIRHPMAFIRATLVSPLLPSPGIAFLVEECTESEDRYRGFPFWPRIPTDSALIQDLTTDYS
jgi:hypothetical protein